VIFWDKIRGYENKSDNHYTTFARRGSNVAMDVDESATEMTVRNFNQIAHPRHCHIAKEPFFQRRFSMVIRGNGFQRIVQFTHYAEQVGLLRYWAKTQERVNKFKHVRLMDKSEDQESTQF